MSYLQTLLYYLFVFRMVLLYILLCSLDILGFKHTTFPAIYYCFWYVFHPHSFLSFNLFYHIYYLFLIHFDMFLRHLPSIVVFLTFMQFWVCFSNFCACTPMLISYTDEVFKTYFNNLKKIWVEEKWVSINRGYLNH